MRYRDVYMVWSDYYYELYRAYRGTIWHSFALEFLIESDRFKHLAEKEDKNE